MPKRPSSDATRRASCRSGVTSAAVALGSRIASRSAQAIARASACSFAACSTPTPSKAVSGKLARRRAQRAVRSAGASAAATQRARATSGAAGAAPSGSTASGATPIARTSLCMPNCGWPITGVASPGACSSARVPASIAVSYPGRTTAPCGSLATVAISSAVAGIVPVEPATITGPAGGAASRRAASARIIRLR